MQVAVQRGDQMTPDEVRSISEVFHNEEFDEMIEDLLEDGDIHGARSIILQLVDDLYFAGDLDYIDAAILYSTLGFSPEEAAHIRQWAQNFEEAEPSIDDAPHE